MNLEFKKIIFKLAKLSRGDQLWVLKKLTVPQREQFNALQGTSLLQDARKFRRLHCPEVPQLVQTISLPEACQTLCLRDPLYIAIILDQGAFSWEPTFLEMCAQQVEIKELLQTQVPALKPATKRYVFEQWQSNLSFNDQLEADHGNSL